MDVNHIHKIASRQHLDKCLVNHWRLAWPCWHRRLTITVPVKLYPLKNLSIYIVIIAFCSPLGFAVNYVFCGDQNKWGLLMCVHDRLYGERGYVLERLKCSMPFPDLWSSGVWGLMQAWAGRTASVFWSLSIPSLVSGVWGLSNVGVWVTVVSCSRLSTSCRIGGLQTGEWFLVWPKVLWNVYEASLSHRQGGGGACSASSSDPHVVSWRKSKLDGETWPSHGVSPCLTL